MRILLDTNVLARAAAGRVGPAYDLVLCATRTDHVLVVSPFLVAELSRVLRYERLRPIHRLTDPEIDQYVNDLIAVAEMVIPASPEAVVSADPQDDPIIATAVSGQVDVLCTADRHLLHPEVVAYCRARRIAVMTDLELLPLIREGSH